jgi:spore germination protein YaaH
VAPLATVSPTLVATRDLPVAWRKLEPCPASDPCYLYVVKRGDTLRVIAARFDTTIKKLRKLNPKLGDPSTIRVGSTIRVPPPPS